MYSDFSNNFYAPRVDTEPQTTAATTKISKKYCAQIRHVCTFIKIIALLTITKTNPKQTGLVILVLRNVLDISNDYVRYDSIYKDWI